MATSSSTKTDPATEQRKLNLKMRGILNDAYSFVRGREFTKKLGNITYEQLVDEAIDRIDGTPGKQPLRPTLLTRIASLKADIKTAVATVSKKSINYWSLDNQDENVNTDETDSSKTS